MDSLKNKTQQNFIRDDVTGDGKDANCLERKIREYNRTGKFSVHVNKVYDDYNKHGTPGHSTMK